MKACLQIKPMYCSRDYNFTSRFNQQYDKSTSNSKSLFENQMENSQFNDKHSYHYNLETKQFALTLHYYSQKAYECVLNVFFWPHSSTIRSWATSVDCEPGFFLWTEPKSEVKICYYVKIVHIGYVGINVLPQQSMKEGVACSFTKIWW